MWQSLVQEIEAGTLELALGDEAMPEVSVCTIVVGTSSVVVIRMDDSTVDTIVEAGI